MDALDRTKNLFRFLKAFAERNVPIHRSLSQHAWTLRLRDLPVHPCIGTAEVLVGDADADAPDEEPPALIRVARPKLTQAPRPPAILGDYLDRVWERADGSIRLQPARNVERNGETVTERFEDDPARVLALDEWRTAWNTWAEAERPALQVARLFERFYELHGRIERESEQVELVLGDGRLRWNPADGAAIDHPILLQRVELHFDANVPEFTVVDAERAPELYGPLVSESSELSPAKLSELRSELEKAGYHPSAQEETSGFLRRLAQLLAAGGVFHEKPIESAPGRDPAIVRDPVLFLRSRPSGYPAAFDRVLEDLEERQSLPDALVRLVGVDPPRPPEAVEPPPSPWGEPPDVLLSKPANAEQVQIARALERHRAVLVQGPPGTGKSHTIANLIGHLVAQGKRVLVTSHTTKALRVLRDQVVPDLQPLCVAVLDNDAESRGQMEQSVRGILSRITTANEQQLEQEIASLTAERQRLNDEITAITSDLLTIRSGEYTPIVVGGISTRPADAARWVGTNETGNDWIPGPVAAGAPLPLSAEEVADLYDTNGQISRAEESEIDGGLPEVGSLPTAAEFARLAEEIRFVEPQENATLWARPAAEEETEALGACTRTITAASEDLDRLEPWQRAVVAAGHSGGAEQELWTELERQIGVMWDGWERSRGLLLEHEVEIDAALATGETRRCIADIGAHISSGGTVGTWVLLTRPGWKKVVRGARINGAPPRTATEFRAIAAHLGLEDARRKLAVRWGKQAVPAGLPEFGSLGTSPEPILREYASGFAELLAWWPARWIELQHALQEAGFRWEEFRRREVARSAPALPFDRDTAILCGPLREVVSARAAAARRARAQRVFGVLDAQLAEHRSTAAGRLREAVRSGDAAAYESALGLLQALSGKVPAWSRRRALLRRLAASARHWALAIHNRQQIHGDPAAPGNVEAAWRWRQLQQEIAGRAELDEIALTRRLHEVRDALRTCTAALIDRKAWREQLGRTGLAARQALQGWADTVRRIGKGTGKRAPKLKAEARRLLVEARDAVPVWIMPLARVAESFDPVHGRFDVVIVDEASQSDVTGLLAWYLGDSVAIVGDHEQVSPLGVGQDLAAMQSLINQHLHGVPNNHLYDGTTSIYDLARQSFGGTIALREHFRCVPDIIEFSNELSYNLEIRPLRDPSVVPRPHVAEFVVHGARRQGSTNLAEARWIAALIKAVTEAPGYAGKSIGAITLLGDEQAGLIQDVAVSLMGAVVLEGRRFVAGNSAQFQGDERDVIFLSMVDTPTGGRLPIRQTPAFKQRYNVAASRARDQLWLVHSLDPGSDLQEGDLRRRLIDHVRDPEARRRALVRAQQRAESQFELAVIQHLHLEGYRVESQVWVGGYRIDLVVSDDNGQVAIECDGDRFHGPDQIPHDMARQAVLERAGWRFIRVRGTRFFRDPEHTMRWVFDELRGRGVRPIGTVQAELQTQPHGDLRERVVRRAWEVMHERGWVDGPGDPALVHTDPGLSPSTEEAAP